MREVKFANIFVRTYCKALKIYLNLIFTIKYQQFFNMINISILQKIDYNYQFYLKIK